MKSLWVCRFPRALQAIPPGVLVRPASAALLPAALESKGLYFSTLCDVNVPFRAGRTFPCRLKRESFDSWLQVRGTEHWSLSLVLLALWLQAS